MPEHSKRRATPRAVITAPVMVTAESGESAHMFAGNISEGGVFLQTQTPLAAGTEVELTLALEATHEMIQASGLVVWMTTPGGPGTTGMGVLFTALTDVARGRIRALVASLRANAASDAAPTPLPPPPSLDSRPPSPPPTFDAPPTPLPPPPSLDSRPPSPPPTFDAPPTPLPPPPSLDSRPPSPPPTFDAPPTPLPPPPSLDSRPPSPPPTFDALTSLPPSPSLDSRPPSPPPTFDAPPWRLARRFAPPPPAPARIAGPPPPLPTIGAEAFAPLDLDLDPEEDALEEAALVEPDAEPIPIVEPPPVDVAAAGPPVALEPPPPPMPEDNPDDEWRVPPPVVVGVATRRAPVAPPPAEPLLLARESPPAARRKPVRKRAWALPPGTLPPILSFPPIIGKSSKRMIGIDLGTAFSCAMWVDQNGAPKPIPVDKGRRSFASNVFVRGDNILLGNQAREHQETSPANVIHSWKRLLGRRFDSAAVRDAIGHAAYPIESGPAGETVVRLDNIAWLPAWFAARVLFEIRVWTRDCLDEVVDSAVITVPAFYTAPQRAAVKEGAALAGFNHVRLLHEPVAAAIAYGMGKSMDQRILVYDLGGGTFDVTLVEIDGNAFEVTATGGDAYLGGVDFDDRVIGHLLVSFLNEHQVDLSNDVLALSRIRVAGERAKMELSERPSTRVTIPYIAKRDETALRLDVELSRDKLSQLTHDLVDRTIASCDRLLQHARLTKADIDEVLLVGGMTRMPAVRERVEEHFGKPPRHGVHPDEAVAAGAALFASSLGERDSVAVLDVLSMAIGVEGPPGELNALIDAKSALPAERAVEITAVADGQTAVEVEVFQGASTLIADCEYIGSLKVDALPVVARGAVICVVRFRLDEEGALSLEAVDSTLATRGSIRLVTAPRRHKIEAATGRGRGFFARILGLR